MTTQTPARKFVKQTEKVHIDFSTLKPHELSTLSNKWERDARGMEMKIQSYQAYASHDPFQLSLMYRTANKLWIRLRILEDWRNTHK